MAMFKEETEKNLLEAGKFVAAIAVGVIGVMAWLDGRFIASAMADDFVKKTEVMEMQRIIKFQEFNYVTDKIEKEEAKPIEKQKKIKIDSLYKQKFELKKDLGL